MFICEKYKYFVKVDNVVEIKSLRFLKFHKNLKETKDSQLCKTKFSFTKVDKIYFIEKVFYGNLV